MSTMLTTTTELLHQFQTKYNKDLLKRAIQLTVLDQFATKMPFPKNMGAKKMRFFRQESGASSNVSTITEGTLLATLSEIGLDYVEATMAQYGQRYNISDVLGKTELISTLLGVKSRIAEESALHADDIVRDALCKNTGSGPGLDSIQATRMYAQGAASFAALSSAGLSASTLTIEDVLRAMTQLQINRAPKKNGKYYLVVPPQLAFNLMLDVKYFIPVGTYQDKGNIVKGEVGTWWGVSIVVATNPFRETISGTEGTFVSGGGIYDAIATGMDAFGTPQMAGESEYNPKIKIIDTPDKLDALNQWTVVAWSSYWCAQTLNANWVIALKAKTSFA